MTPHEGVIVLSTKRPAPEPVPVRVNTHPGPDLDILQRVRDRLLVPPADSTEGDAAA